MSLQSVALPGGAVPPPELRCFTITANGRVFGLPVEYIETVFEFVAVTPVPLAPAAVLGLANLRGKIVTAVSLRRRLGHDAQVERSRLAVGLDFRGEGFALIVDEVGDVIALPASAQIDIPPHLGDEGDMITAVYRLPEVILPVLDLDWVFDFNRR